MNRIGADIEAARAALARAEQALLLALESSPAFQALRQLDERAARGEPLTSLSEADLRLRLEQRLDDVDPGWRDLPRISAALLALGRPPAPPPFSELTTLDESKDEPSIVPWRPQAPACPPRDTAGSKPHAPADVADPPTNVLSRIRSLETKSALPAQTSEKPAAGSRSAVTEIEVDTSSVAIESDPSHRIAALETIADRLAQGRVEAQRDPSPPRLDADDADPEMASFEEAEVEIVTALPSEPPSWSERFLDPPQLTEQPQPAPFSLETFIDDEAEVEIVIAAQSGEPAPAPGLPHRSNSA